MLCEIIAFLAMPTLCLVEYVFGIYGIPWQAIREALEAAAAASAAEQGSGVAASATALGSLADSLGAFLAWARHEPSVFEIVAGPYFLLLFWTNLRWWRFGRGGKGPFIGGPGDVVPALATRVIYSSFWLAVIAVSHATCLPLAAALRGRV